MKQIEHGDSRLVLWLKHWDKRILEASFGRARLVLGAAVVLLLLSLVTVPFFPRAFLPAFNEGTLTISMMLNPGHLARRIESRGQVGGIADCARAGSEKRRAAHRARRARRTRRRCAFERDRRRSETLRTRP